MAWAVATGAAVGAIVSRYAEPAIAALSGWNVAGLVLLTLTGSQVGGMDPADTRSHAAGEDPGRTTVYVGVVVTSLVSLFTATFVAHQAASISFERELLVGLCLWTVAQSWVLTHTSFTMRYAHLYYREGLEGVGGLEFPGEAPPTYSDFAYFGFTVGMCFQVSDVTVSRPQIRRVVLLHALLSFAYSTVILAFTLNLMFGRL